MENTKQNIAESTSLELVRARLENWRATRIKRTRIPKDIWSDILDLLTDHSKGKISQTLGVGYEQINQHLNARREEQIINEPVTVKNAHPFIELEAGMTNVASNTIEIKNARGLTMTLHTQNEKLIVSIIQSFYRDNHATNHAAA